MAGYAEYTVTRQDLLDQINKTGWMDGEGNWITYGPEYESNREQARKTLAFYDQLGVDSSDQIPLDIKIQSGLFESNSPKTFGGQVKDFVTNPGVLLAAGGLGAMYAAPAAGAGTGAGTTSGGVTVGTGAGGSAAAGPTIAGTATGGGAFVNSAGALLPAAGAALQGGGTFTPPPQAGGAGGAAGTAAASTALQNILRDGGSAADYLSVLGDAAPGLIGAYGSSQQGDRLQGIADRARADRMPFLNKANEWLAGGPEAYAAGPGSGALRGTLAQLGASVGNPIGSGTALSLASQSGLSDWRNAVTGMANLGLGGEATQANLNTQAVREGNIWPALGDAAGSVFGNQGGGSLEELLKKYGYGGGNTNNIFTPQG